MTLYRVKACCLMQMESGVRSNVGSTLMVCNPELQTYDRLLGLNTMKMLQLADLHATDQVIDPVGRPFRKYSHRRLPQLLLSIKAWNRKHAPALPRPSHKPENPTRHGGDFPVVEDITQEVLERENRGRRQAEDRASAEVLRTLFQVSAQFPEKEMLSSERQWPKPSAKLARKKPPRVGSPTPKEQPSGQPRVRTAAEGKASRRSGSRWWPDTVPGHNVKIRSSVFKGMRKAPVVPTKHEKPGAEDQKEATDGSDDPEVGDVAWKEICVRVQL